MYVGSALKTTILCSIFDDVCLGSILAVLNNAQPLIVCNNWNHGSCSAIEARLCVLQRSATSQQKVSTSRRCGGDYRMIS